MAGSKWLGLAALCVLATSPVMATDPTQSPAASTDSGVTPEELNLAREILTHAFPPDQRLQMTLNTSRSMAEQAMLASMQSVIDPEIRRITKDYLDEFMQDVEPAISRFLPHQFEAMELAYAREFTLEELAQVNQFAQTPAGQRYLQRSQTLLNDPGVVAANRVLFEDVERIQNSRMPILIERLRAYREQHTDSATKP